MRRKEFLVTGQGEIDGFLRSQKTGVLAMAGGDGYPYAVPVNYAWHGGRVLVHGAKEGKKSRLLRKGKKVQFTVIRELAFIPSFFTGGRAACGAGQFFQSVMVFGTVALPEGRERAAECLQAFMEAFQPEGGYEKIASGTGLYGKSLEKTAVYMIEPARITAKFKLGQNMDDGAFERVVRALEERNGPLDRETVGMMKQYRPA